MRKKTKQDGSKKFTYEKTNILVMIRKISMRISDETNLEPESNHLYLTEAPLKGKPRQRRRS